jgi:hypothetical protein
MEYDGSLPRESAVDDNESQHSTVTSKSVSCLPVSCNVSAQSEFEITNDEVGFGDVADSDVASEDSSQAAEELEEESLVAAVLLESVC